MVREGKIIPPAVTGDNTGATSTLEAHSRHEAILLFKEAKARLLDINNWHKLCGDGSSTFHLVDKDGNPVINREPVVGDLIRIDLPAFPNGTAEGNNWVRIEKFENEKNLLKDEEIFGFMVRPTAGPVNAGVEAAHFDAVEATGTFLVSRNANTVVAMEKGRNDKPNLNPLQLITKLRNGIIAIASMVGLATPQWKSLMNGIIKGPDMRWERKII